MKVTINYRFLNPRAIWQSLVERHLKTLEKIAAIASANVTLERDPDDPAFRVRVLLEIPGPDIHAEARDYTIQAAVLKVVRNLEHQMKTRRARHRDKRKSPRRLFQGRPAMA